MVNPTSVRGRLRYDLGNRVARIGVTKMVFGESREVPYLLMVDTTPLDIIGPEDVAYAFTTLRDFGAPDGASLVVSGYAGEINGERAFLVTRFIEIKRGSSILWRVE